MMATEDDLGKCCNKSWISLIFNLVPYLTQGCFIKSYYSSKLMAEIFSPVWPWINPPISLK